jgi:diaminobutyrate-2-oxoglutarate transaminase
MLLIVDDIQVGNGRTGDFFSFERAGITPDLVTLSKSVGGGLPLALLLLRPEHDQWEPGEHTGTFRGNNLAFVAAAEALAFWDDPTFGEEVVRKGERLRSGLEEIAARVPRLAPQVRGLGMIRGLALSDREVVAETTERAFERGLVIETAGARGQVLKCLPALTMDDALLEEGLAILGEALAEAARRGRS